MVDRFNVVVEGLNSVANLKRSNESYSIDYKGLQNLLKVLKRNGGKVVSITKAGSSRQLSYAGVLPTAPTEYRSVSTEDDLQVVIRAVYRQILGNGYVMESEELSYAESQLRNSDITVREFVRLIAKSDLYKSRFFAAVSQTRFVELNFKHFLGRAPYSQAEISEHIQRYAAAGYDAEIDSYLDSTEYQEVFGVNVVPFNRGFLTQKGQVNANFVRSLKLYNGFAGSDIPGASSRSALFAAL